MPDWSELSIGEHFAVALRPRCPRRIGQVLGKSPAISALQNKAQIFHDRGGRAGDSDQVPAGLDCQPDKAMERLPPVIYITPGNHDVDSDVAVQEARL